MPNDKPGPNDMVFYVGDEALPGGTHYLWKLVNKQHVKSQDKKNVVAQNCHIIPLMIVDKLMQERCYEAVMKAASTLATAAIAYMLPSVAVEDVAQVYRADDNGGLGERFNLSPKAKPAEPSAN